MKQLNILIKNFTSSAAGNIISQVLAFLTVLYLPNVLGPRAYGIYNSAVALMMYFVLLTDLGLSLYCIREANKGKGNNDIINKVFILKLYLSSLASVLFIIISSIIYKDIEQKMTFIFMSIGVFAMGIFVDYAFNSKNDMKYVGLGNVIRNLLFFVFIIIFVKSNKDVYYSSLLYSVSLLISSLYLIFIYGKKYTRLKFIKFNFNDFRIIRYALPMAIALLMVQINNNFDIIYLSFVKGDEVVGYYSAAYRIINALISIMVFYFNSAYPTISELYSNDKTSLSTYIEKFYIIGASVIFPITFGGIALSKKIIITFYSERYLSSVNVFSILLVLLIIRYVSSTFGAVLLMGNGGKKYTFSVIIGATINIILNILFVPKYSFVGSSVATIICETVQLSLLYYYCSKELKFKFIKNTLVVLFCSLIMYFFLRSINFNLILSIILGGGTYISVFSIINFRRLICLIKSKV